MPAAPVPTTADFLAAFNNCTSPKEALASARAAGHDVESLSVFLASRDDVDPEVLGACLGHHDPFWKDFAVRFPAHWPSLASLGVLPALRRYIATFKLPGESAQIERILDGFARAFFEANPAPEIDSVVGSTVDPCAVGWYVVQPNCGTGVECCVSCGKVAGKENAAGVKPCQGCNVVSFCRRCGRLASRNGHAVAGSIGFGRACIAAVARRSLGQCNRIYFSDPGALFRTAPCQTSAVVPDWCKQWERVSPFKSSDAVMVLCYAIVMLTTNLHNPKVKSKMAKQEFIQQNDTSNDGKNFPGRLVYSNVHRHAHPWTCKQKYARTCGHVHMCADMCIDMCILVCAQKYARTCGHVYVCTDMCIDMCRGMCIDMCVDLCTQ